MSNSITVDLVSTDGHIDIDASTQVFRTAALALFDPQLIVLGPSAYVILDLFGVTGYKFFALAYPTLVGIAAASLGYQLFRRGDLP